MSTSARSHAPARASHADPRSPLVLDTRELGRRPGSMRLVRRTFEAPAGWELELVRVPAGATVELDVRLEAVMEGVLVTGTLTGPLAADCGRCLEPVTGEIEVALQELFGYEPSPADDEAPVLDGDLLNLTDLVRDAVVLALPLNPVCDDDCAGLCSGCGARLADLGPEHSHDILDPRWAALGTIDNPTQTEI